MAGFTGVGSVGAPMAGGKGAFGGVSLTGDKDLERKLLLLPKAMQRRVLKQAVGFAARRPRKMMRDKLRKRQDTGAVRKSISIRVRTYPSGNTVAIVGPRRNVGTAKSGLLYHPSTTQYKSSRLGGKQKGGPQRVDKVAISIERGWRGRAPFPFMRQTFEASKAFVVKDFQRAIGNKIAKLALTL